MRQQGGFLLLRPKNIRSTEPHFAENNEPLGTTLRENGPIRRRVWRNRLSYGACLAAIAVARTYRGSEDEFQRRMEIQASWIGPYSWPGFEEINGLSELPGFPGVYLWTVEYLSGYLVYAAGLTRRQFRDRFKEHTGKYLAGEYTVLNISEMQLGRRLEVWHGWGWTPAKRAQFAERQTEIREAARRQLAGFRVFVANLEPSGRVLERLEAAIMNQLYHEASPLCDVPDPGMMLRPRRETEEPITVWSVCESKLHGLPASFTI